MVAITSLQPGTNLYVAPDGKWLGTYIPASLRAYSFKLARQEGSDESILCINEASRLVVNDIEEADAFFDDANQHSARLINIFSLLSKVEANRVVTQRAVNALAEACLILPWELRLKQGEEVLPTKGLFRADEAAVNKLDDEQFSTVRNVGRLPIAYAQLMSMNQLAMPEYLGGLRGQILAQQEFVKSGAGLGEFSLCEHTVSLNFDSGRFRFKGRDCSAIHSKCNCNCNMKLI